MPCQYKYSWPLACLSQGESAVDEDQGSYDGAANYACRMSAAVTGWRRHFQQQWPFFFVEMAATRRYPSSDSAAQLAALRLAQRSVLTLPKVDFVTAIDLGSDNGSKYSPRKDGIARRMARLIARELYNSDALSIAEDPPRILSISMDGMAKAVQLVFSGSGVRVGATANSAPASCERVEHSPFELGFDDGTWMRLTPEANTSPGVVMLRIPVVSMHRAHGMRDEPTPTEVRYAWEDSPACALYAASTQNAVQRVAVHPAAPFRIAIQRLFSDGSRYASTHISRQHSSIAL